MRTWLKILVTILIGLLSALSVLVACGSGNNNEQKETPADTIEPIVTATQEPIKIIIGNLSDLTGVSSNAMGVINMAVEDTVEYYNEHNLIPGVELEVITYDGQFNPSHDIPGYEFLKESGADLIFTAVPPTPITLKPYVDKDKMVLFAWAPTKEAIEPPGYIFSPCNTLSEYAGYTLLKYVAENDPDFPKNRPASIGGAYWAETYGNGVLAAAKEYANAHPDQYEWEEGFLVNFGFNWATEVEELKDCDYVLPPVVMTSFIDQYRSAGHSAKFLATEAQVGFLGQVDDSDLWDELDGTIFVRACRWWNEDAEMVNLAKTLLQENHSGDEESIIRDGVGYLAVNGTVVLLTIISDTVEAVGAENFNSQALYDITESFSFTIDGIERDSFSKTKRTSLNYVGIYEAHGAERDIFRADPEYIPIIYEP